MKNKQNNNTLFHRATKKPKTERVWDGDDMCKIPCVVSNQVGIPQDVDTKIALHNIEERGVTAINELLDLGEESYNMDSSVSQGGSNSANYDHIKWEDKEAKEFEDNLKQFFMVAGVILIVVALFVVMIAVIARAETKFVECRLEKYKKVNGEWHCIYLGANKTRTSMIVSEFCPRSYMCEYDPNSSDKLLEW